MMMMMMMMKKIVMMMMFIRFVIRQGSYKFRKVMEIDDTILQDLDGFGKGSFSK